MAQGSTHRGGPDRGVVFARDGNGRRSTSAVGQTVVSTALAEVDSTGAEAARRETSWRSGYLPHIRRLTLAGLGSRPDAEQFARDGLAALDLGMAWAAPDGDRPITDLLSAEPDVGVAQSEVAGSGDPEGELTVPYRGTRLAGTSLRDRLESWVADGIVEPSFADAITTVMDNPAWLRLDGRTVAVLGAGAEMGPAQALLRWGASVAALDLPGAPGWEPLIEHARRSGGRLLVPTAEGASGPGLDLIEHVPAIASWLVDIDDDLVISNDVYAPGSAFVRVALAADAVSRRVATARPTTALAFLATPTDTYGVPERVVESAVAEYRGRSRWAKLLGRPLRTLSGGRLLRRPYAESVKPGICDALVPQQGPNYALAKRLQRWRATEARRSGTVVSLHVAPATRTRSVTRNRALAAAYAGAHRFGVEVFEPGTTNTLMAALLVHDLHAGPLSQGRSSLDQVWQDEAYAAAHGGIWTCRYAPRSVLGMAALLGLGGARG
ncbi:hypothetical protein [Euzebya tangerina]|uniref:hypothetical protein n=1 Tax=Euzebya tangerina TaxID=591198 RepID=UPI000E319E2F|nr:hypothetical protein [Euzebya tangerina]